MPLLLSEKLTARLAITGASSCLTLFLSACGAQPESGAISEVGKNQAQILLVSETTEADPASAQPAASLSEKLDIEQAISTTDNEQVSFEKSLLGSWTDRFHGTRTMKFHDDQTGTMILELDSIGAMLYGSKLEFDFTWKVNQNLLEMKMAGGRPQKTVESLGKSWGNDHQYQLHEITGEQLTMKSRDGKTTMKLKRIQIASAPSQTSNH